MIKFQVLRDIIGWSFRNAASLACLINEQLANFVGNTQEAHMKRLLCYCCSMSRTNCLKVLQVPSSALDFVHTCTCKHTHLIPDKINQAPRQTAFKQEVVGSVFGLCNVFFNICIVDIDFIRMITLLWETAFFHLRKLMAIFKSSYVTLRAQ